MSKAQVRGTSPLTIWLVVFAVLWLGTTIWLVVLYTDLEKLKQDRQSALDRLARVIDPGQENLDLAKKAQGSGGPTVVGLFEEARAKTAKAAVGDPAKDATAVAAMAASLCQKIADGGLVSDPARYRAVALYEALDALYGEFSTLSSLKKQAEDRSAGLDQRLTEAIEVNAKQKTDYDNRVKQLEQQLASCEGSRSSYVSDYQAQIGDITTRADKAASDLTAAITEERQQKADVQQKYNELLHRYQELQKKVGALQVQPQVNVTARQADGRVLKAVPGDDTLYINLGSRDALVLGLEFAVYDAREGIPADGRSKARVRVERIFEDSAECRIVERLSRDIVIDGDLVANPIYDRSRPLKFTVAGDFDLDRDGQMDSGGEMGIESLVAEWGGKVDERLSALTDFIVVGVRPVLASSGGELAPELVQRNKSIEMRQQRYDKIIDDARTLSIPILTQEVFLQFLGRRGGRPTYAAN